MNMFKKKKVFGLKPLQRSFSSITRELANTLTLYHKFGTLSVWEKRSGEESCRIQSQEDQELSEDTTTTTLITQKSNTTQSVDLTKKGMGNITWEVFTKFSHCIVSRSDLWDTSPTRHLKAKISEDTCQWGCVRHTDTCATNSHVNQICRTFYRSQWDNISVDDHKKIHGLWDSTFG